MPIEVECGGCGASYTLKDEFAGKKLRCKQCESVIEVPVLRDAVETGAETGSESWGIDAAFRRDRFLLKQKKLAISEKYYVYDDRQNPIMFIVRPARFWRQVGAALGIVVVLVAGLGLSIVAGFALSERQAQKTTAVVAGVGGSVLTIVAAIAVGIVLSPKRHISIYSDDSKSRLLLEVLQDHKVNIIRATYTVMDPVDGCLGKFQKNYLYNMFRRRWYGMHPDGSVFIVAKEDSLILSLLRRLLGSIELLGMFLVTNFVFLLPGSSKVIGEFNRKFTLFDQYVLDLTADHERVLDRRLAVALGVLLDTGERR